MHPDLLPTHMTVESNPSRLLGVRLDREIVRIFYKCQLRSEDDKVFNVASSEVPCTATLNHQECGEFRKAGTFPFCGPCWWGSSWANFTLYIYGCSQSIIRLNLGR